MAVQTRTVAEICAAAKQASRVLATMESGPRDGALRGMADDLEARAAEILEANARDVGAGEEAGLSSALLDRLRLTPERISAMAAGVREIAALPDPVGEVLDGRRLPNGLQVRKVRVPLGVVAVVYESRPNVTIDCSALAIKSGNAIVLRGSSMAAHSNAVLAEIARSAVDGGGIPVDAVSLVAGGGRDELRELASQSDYIDLLIPRGGEGLKAALKEHATVPVIYAASGNCHLFVDNSAEPGRAVAMTLNAKVQRPGVCNAIETLLVHADIAPLLLPALIRELQAEDVEVRVDARARSCAPADIADSLADATEEDWATEFLDLILAVKVVDSVEEAIAHVNRYGSGHSEAILTDSESNALDFTNQVDAACVYVNASTRFTDGGQFGMGAEIGNSTQKLHARGPIGVRELCTYKYVVEGSGQIRP
jgi:glutamate-5-semialdehyde dehydrogenase